MRYIRSPGRFGTQRAARRPTGRRWRGRGGKRGVSDVIATIILLAMTVVLFSSIFAFVTTFPGPPAQNVTQFSANLVLTANQSYVAGIQITHLAGPPVSGSALIYFKSAYHPQAAEFLNPIPASTGLGGATTWNLGQTFSYTFSCVTLPTCQQPVLPDNITVLIVTSNQLVFSTILPGNIIMVPPSFVSTSITPASPAVRASFLVTAVVAGTTNNKPVYVNLASIPGLGAVYPSAQQMTYNAGTNRYTFVVPANLTTSNGTYYAFVNVTNTAGQSATAGVAVTLTSSSSTTEPVLQVAVVMIPQPPSFPAVSAYFAAVVSYTGTLTNKALTVTFWANQTPGSIGMATPWKTASTSLAGPTGLTISGPSTVTVYSSSPATFSAWLFNSSDLISASGTVATVGSASGTTAFASANLVQGIVAAIPPTSFSHSCVAAACPFLNDTVWDNWSTAIKFTGKMFVNLSGVNKNTYPFTNVSVAGNSHTTASGPGATKRWVPAAAGTYLITTVLTIYAGGIVVGYIYDTFSIVVT